MIKDKALNYLDILSYEIMHTESTQDPFWENSAADLMSAAVLSLIVNNNLEQINFNSVSSIINACNTTDGINYFNNFEDETIRNYAAATVNAPRETRGGIVSVASQKLRLYATRERLSIQLSESDFSFDILNDKCAIFIEMNKVANYMSSLVRIFISYIRNYVSDSLN